MSRAKILPNGFYCLRNEGMVGERTIAAGYASVIIKELDPSGLEERAVTRAAMGHTTIEGNRVTFFPMIGTEPDTKRKPSTWEVQSRGDVFVETLIPMYEGQPEQKLVWERLKQSPNTLETQVIEDDDQPPTPV